MLYQKLLSKNPIPLLTIACLGLLPCAFAESLTGTLASEVSTAVDGSIERDFLLKLKSGKERSLIIDKATTTAFEQLIGSELEITGHMTPGQGVIVETYRHSTNMPQTMAAKTRKNPASRTIAFVRVEFPGLSVDLDYGELSQIMFIGGFGSMSINSIITRDSFNAVSFDNNEFRRNRKSVPPSAIIERRPGESCSTSYRTWSERALRILAPRGFSADDFDHVVFLFPEHDSLGCRIVGRGEMFGKYSWIFRHKASTILHELGHNFGFHHAGVSESNQAHANYADASSAMGAFNSGVVGFNAANIVQIGWATYAADKIVTINSLGSFKVQLASLHSFYYYQHGTLPSIIRIVPPGGGAPFIVSSRSDSNVPPRFSRGLSIHRDYGLGRMTRLLGVVPKTGTLLDLEEGVAIHFVSNNNNAIYNVSIQTFPVSVKSTLRAELELETEEDLSSEHCIIIDPCNALANGTDTTERLISCSGRALSRTEVEAVQAIAPNSCAISGIDLTQDSNRNYVVDALDWALDSDGDGRYNDVDCAPLDPTRWEDKFVRDQDQDGIADATTHISVRTSTNLTICEGDVPPDGYLASSRSGYSSYSFGVDNCPFISNPDQLDSDFDGIGDACDSDSPRIDITRSTLASFSQMENILAQVRHSSNQQTKKRWLRSLEQIVATIKAESVIKMNKTLPSRKNLRKIKRFIAKLKKDDGDSYAETDRSLLKLLRSLKHAILKS